ncbi:RrF2 family transcriptional regulator [Catalinimonas niigatensis]|uniref:RrF2 family transcriptional regulator n=1 Tax=Catalinimonas niigatensis TaxID=1397264 RepID=UPI0026660D9E|nr:Rrf2 family transcriptional regulator [Catalinimonas niigatensis]WPP51952.1 Rrf2 family transcriptional regulator [Catalinimonas niigatensis]
MFSKACEYGIRATIYVAVQSLEDKRTSLKGIANEIGSPVAFTAKILQQLVRNKIMSSVMGPAGGFQIEKKKIDQITLSQIVDAIDGDSIYRGCGLGLKECNTAQPCPVHDKFARIRDELKYMLNNTTLFELASGLETGLTFLKR